MRCRIIENVANDSTNLAFPGDYRRKLHLAARIPRLALYTISIM